MADPFSIIASTIGVIDVAVRLTAFLIDVKEGSETIDQDLDRLLGEIKSLNAISRLIQESFERDVATSTPNQDEEAAVTMWRETGNVLRDSQKTLSELELLIKKVHGLDGSSTYDRVRRFIRKQVKEDEFARLWTRLNDGYHLLQILLSAINITYTRRSQETSNESFQDLSSTIQALGSTIQDQIASVIARLDKQNVSPWANRTRHVLETAQFIRRSASLNAHFMIPQTVSGSYRGRKVFLETLKREYMTPGTPGTLPQQKRFVIYGLGGSGKTQFCCKFAQDNKQDFWGVFYIDAGSEESTVASYAEIAEKAATKGDKIEGTEKAVKYWLSSHKQPWLLIIDNVDERLSDTSPESYLPESDAGLVLFTTRNQSLRSVGNFGPRFFEFTGLDEDESVDLLLTEACHPSPWATKAISTATDICQTLGYLPLAIVHAGNAILKELCTLDSFLAFFERTFSRLRESIQEKGARQRRNSQSNNETVYSGIEIQITAASEDALELLNLLAFMHRQRFHFEILIQAVMNPQIEYSAEKAAKAQKPNDKHALKPSMKKLLRIYTVRLAQRIMALGEKKVLPRIIRDVQGLDRDDVNLRLRGALADLRSRALVDHVLADDSYSMHPLVHRWARERMSLNQQAIWCHSACNILANVVLLPPLVAGDNDIIVRRHTLPHIEHMRKQQEIIEQNFRQRSEGRWRPWSLERIVGGPDIRQNAKFGLVYAESAQWKEANKMFTIVDDFLSKTIGLEDPIAIRARLFLSATYWWLEDEDKVDRLQFELLDVCMEHRGERDLNTLLVIDKIGVSLWQQCKFQKALTYSQRAVDGFKAIHDGNHTDTFLAMSHLGRVFGKFAEFGKAVNLHEEALEGLRREQGHPEYDQDTIDVMECLAMARYDRHRYDNAPLEELHLALALQLEVTHKRESKLGKQHPITLLGFLNLARIKAGLGDLEEAEKIISSRIPVVVGTLGETHHGTLLGKMFLGHVLTLRGRLSEAEDILEFVVREYENGVKKNHADQLVASAFLVTCYKRQGKHTEAIPVQTKVTKAVRMMFGEDSWWEEYFSKNF
ncbi:hypothetical protein BT63DRAFT_51060 [Microthyrium microscopicum]|uniref:Uncharacterized protein n=1 Tax=Microthyrium microscopicum TaxID=703497 RepID=A0A6A6U1G7_9PEZI|nr:hypothetical protein BT63DRAFT_51060 [Microthyrium microscopicum]